ncbi:hypothetical protein Slala02_31630 [Streptomyces lavendulae subsp. lavendulae]|nr:hypothetical protein Slala01_34910 [Streptomyces lavendulae subsp. lavendulae]GLX27343.1 hypothetical protein Slala02_31630 [Streptomyces lavendulae subsp. lavendulae]
MEAREDNLGPWDTARLTMGPGAWGWGSAGGGVRVGRGDRDGGRPVPAWADIGAPRGCADLAKAGFRITEFVFRCGRDGTLGAPRSFVNSPKGPGDSGHNFGGTP